MTEQHSSTPPREPDPANSEAADLAAKGHREQAEAILRESEERTEDPSTTDPDDHSVIRRRAEETAGSGGVHPDDDEDDQDTEA